MAKTNPDAFSNIKTDLTNTFDKFKNGFDENIDFKWNGFKNEEGKFTLWPFEKTTVPVTEVPTTPNIPETN